MEAINSLLVGALGPLGPLMVVGGLGLLLILVTLPFLITKKEDPLEKLKRSNAEQSRGDAKHDRLRNAKSNKKLERYSSFLEPQNEAEYSAMRQKMLQAGYRSKDAVRYFHFAQFSLGILGLIVGVVYFLLFLAADDPDMQKTLNLKVKYRESFRPFAPSVLREDVSDWFEIDSDSPYMLMVADVAENRRRQMTDEEQARLREIMKE